MSWSIQESEFFENKFKKFIKNNPGIDQLLLDNLDTYHKALNQGISPLNIKAGFIHHEPNGVKAVDQKGGNRKNLGKPKQSRLYIYPDPDTRMLYLITVGDKNSQKK